jgi:hypothetical protein
MEIMVVLSEIKLTCISPVILVTEQKNSVSQREKNTVMSFWKLNRPHPPTLLVMTLPPLFRHLGFGFPLAI